MPSTPLIAATTEFLRWWARQLAALLAAPFRHDTGDGTVLRLDGDHLELTRRRHGRLTPLGRFPLDPAGAARARVHPRLLLQADPASLLDRDLDLPLAAAADPAAVIRLDLDRLTPFAADEIVWTHRVTCHDRARRRLLLRLAILPKSAVAAPLAALDRLGLAPAFLTIPRPDGTWLDLPRHAGPPQAHRFDRAALRLAALACAILVPAALAAPFAVQEHRLREADARIAALRPAVAEADRLRRDAAPAATPANPSPLMVIARLAAALPDDTHLTELALRAGHLTIRGQSAEAAGLIARLSAEPEFRAVTFAAPITQAATDGDLFAIRADLVPPR